MNKQIAALRLLFSIDRQLRKPEGPADVTAKRLDKRRGLLRRKISGVLLTSYDALMRAGRYPPIVEVRGSHCGGCNLRLTPQIAREIRRGDGLLACPHCRRLLCRETRSDAFESDGPMTSRPDLARSASASSSGDSPS